MSLTTSSAARVFNQTFYNVFEMAKAHLRKLSKASEITLLKISNGLESSRFVVAMVVRNESARLPYFLRYYRSLGFQQFIVVDNASTDGTIADLMNEDDVSIFSTTASYKKSRFGNDWINYLLSKYCARKWILYVDADELVTYPHQDTKSILNLTNYLSSVSLRSMNCIMIDMYSEHSVDENYCAPGQSPLEICCYYDPVGYFKDYDPVSRTTWIKGGVRGRMFFKNVRESPALNKTPLVLWKKHYAFLKSSHEVWPLGLNSPVPDRGAAVSGAILHFKFLSEWGQRVAEESARQERSFEDRSYTVAEDTKFFFNSKSKRYTDWKSLEKDNLLTGNSWPASLP